MEILDITFRTSIAFIVLLVLSRFLGRREIAQLTYFDFVSAITMGSVAASTLIDRELSIPAGIIALLVWSFWIAASSWASLYSVPARKLLDGEPVIVIHNGKIMENNLKKAHYSIHDLLIQLRNNSVFDPTLVELGLLEPNGQLSILKKETNNHAKSHLAAQELIVNGKLLYDNLHKSGVSEDWLVQQLKSQGITSPAEVTLAYITPEGNLYIDQKSDNDTIIPGQ